MCEYTNPDPNEMGSIQTDGYGEEKLGKVFNDPIHGHVELHPLLVKIIDTPQFQRLRNIKQLGGAYLVYPGASHNRFEHSLGVAHLAGVLVKTLREKQTELKINDRDILCVQIAGLCHDLGHGPFSHLFDQMFMPQACGNADWTHEQASLEMFEYLVKENKLNLFTTENKLNIKCQKDKKDDQRDKENDLVFIKELIYGKPLPENNTTGNGWPYQGRTEKKSFLYEIVSNEQNGIDVDKFDYFARDCHHLGIKNNFHHMRYFKFARVIKVEKDGSKKKRICSRDKEVFNLYEMFHTRIFLFRRVYQHRVTKNVELMIKDTLLKANDQITFTRGSETFTLSTAKDDMEAYATLTDQVTERILQSTQAEMNDAKNILKRIMCRKLYKLLGEAKPKGKAEPNTCKESLKEKLKEALPAEKREKDKDFFEVQLVTFSYGKKEQNPLDNTYFYKKNKHKEGFIIPRNKVSNFLPESFLEQSLRIFWKKLKAEDSNNLQEDVKEALKDWCEENQFEDIYNDSDNQPAQAEDSDNELAQAKDSDNQLAQAEDSDNQPAQAEAGPATS